MGIDNSKSIDSLLLSVLLFVTKLFSKFIVLCRSYSIFFVIFIGLKSNVSIILNKSLPMDFYGMVLTLIEFATIIASLILGMGLNFFKDKFSIKSTFLKVKRQ